MSSKPLAFIIEDDYSQNRIFSIALNKDFELRCLFDGLEAIKQLKQAIPKLIVLDMNLPGLHGSKILEFVRADPKFFQTQIIIATADALQAINPEQGADLILLKPISPKHLGELAKRIMLGPSQEG
jgi:CheY-like chemotaxis protein